MNNPGRYLTLLPPINGADAVSGSPYFTANPGDKAHMWDATVNLQYMPKQYITWWAEAGYRHSDVPYWSGRGGITPPGETPVHLPSMSAPREAQPEPTTSRRHTQTVADPVVSGSPTCAMVKRLSASASW
jgi:hypothetical protein